MCLWFREDRERDGLDNQRVVLIGIQFLMLATTIGKRSFTLTTLVAAQRPTRNPLRRAFEIAGSVSSVVWFVMYFVSIPTFALLYSLALPNGFKHGTIADEPATREERRQLESDMRYCLVRQNFDADNLFADWNDYEILINTISFSLEDSAVDETEVLFTISCRYYNRNQVDARGRFTADTATFRIAIPIVPEAEDDEFAYRPVRVVIPSDSPIPIEVLFRHKFPKERFDGPKPYWRLWKWQSHLLERHAKYSRGLVGSFDDFFTMLYLSAVTITTLGFGDIVPITKWARLSVGFEAVWGVFVIGLFLNSLSREAAKSGS